MNPIISPSLLSCDFLNMASELKALQDSENIWIHLDIMDGHFVSNLTFGIPIIKKISEFSTKPLDAHLMVTNPDFHIEQMKDFNLHNITFHLEATSDCLALIKKAKKDYPNVGVSIKPKTPPAELTDEVLEAADLILVMSVEPGHGGQAFLPSSLEKVAALKERRERLGTSFTIQIDGGINSQTAKLALRAGAENLVAGSAIFKDAGGDYSNRIEQLRLS